MNENFKEYEVDEVEEAIKEIDRENQLKEISEGKERTKSVEMIVTSEQLLQVLTCDKFLKALLISSERTRTTGNETRFHLNIYDNGEVSVSSIEEGMMDSIGDGNSIIIEEGEFPDLERKFADFISIHYHPRAQIICPSEADLSSKLAPLQLIAMVNEKTIKVLLMNTTELGPEGTEIISESLSDELELSQAKIQAVLKKNHVNNLIISYVLNNEKYELSQKSKQEIKKLGSVVCKFFD